MEGYNRQGIKWFFSERKAEETQERWLNKFAEIIAKLKEKSAKLSSYEKFIDIEWIKRVYSYLEEGGRKCGNHISNSPTFKVINEQRFYAFQYFLHEVFEICFLENETGAQESHAKALLAEYQFLEQVADSFGYKIFRDTLFSIHPYFSKGDKELTINNDIKALNAIGVNILCILSEVKEARNFFQDVEHAI